MTPPTALARNLANTPSKSTPKGVRLINLGAIYSTVEGRAALLVALQAALWSPKPTATKTPTKSSRIIQDEASNRVFETRQTTTIAAPAASSAATPIELKRHRAASIIHLESHTSPKAAQRKNAQTTALVHDWCPSWRGGERVLAKIAAATGAENIYTLFDFLPREIKEQHFPDATFHTSVLNQWPKVEKYYRHLFFTCPFLIEQFDVTDYDQVISSSAAFARGVLTRPDQPHLCYVHSPVRYAWDEQFSYLAQGKLGYGPKGLLYRWMMHNLRTWDTRTAHGPDLMLANSNYVKARIQRVYGRDARVVFPPVEIDDFPPVSHKDDYYVTASFLAPYKRTDLVIQAFNTMPNKQLLVVGDGQQSSHLRKLAGPNVTFTGYLPNDTYRATIARARALVFAGCEDFGIALAEAQASGTPLIAFGRGGAVDIVTPLDRSEAPTGVLFPRQSVAAITEAIAHFETHEAEITPEACHQNALRFGPARFNAEILRAVADATEINAARLR
jgi:glycosyltransferase involved in cell wall biosynthesis